MVGVRGRIWVCVRLRGRFGVNVRVRVRDSAGVKFKVRVRNGFGVSFRVSHSVTDRLGVNGLGLGLGIV